MNRNRFPIVFTRERDGTSIKLRVRVQSCEYEYSLCKMRVGTCEYTLEYTHTSFTRTRTRKIGTRTCILM